MLWIVAKLWTHRASIVLAIEIISRLRKTARDFTQEWIRRKIHAKLKTRLIVVSIEIGFLVLALVLNRKYHSLETRLFASTVLWGVSLFNLKELIFSTIPELIELRKTLRSKLGYAVKYLLEVSLVTEMLQLNVVFLIFCLVVGISSRTYLGRSFSYTKPWKEIAASAGYSEAAKHRR